jgi:outer membrane autotransporter protein
MYKWNLAQGSTITGTTVGNPDAYYLVRSSLGAGNFLSAAGDAVLGLQASQSAGSFAQQNSLLKRMGDLRLGNTSLSDSWIDNVWVRSYGEQLNVGSGYGGQGFSATAYGVQLGTDKAWRLDSHNLAYTGLFLGYGSDDLDFRNSRSEGSTDSIFFGAYSSWINDDGWYADATARFSTNDNSLDAYDTVGAKTRSDYDNWYLGGSVEVGKQFKFKDGWFVEPQAEFSYTHVTGNNYTTSGASVFTVDLNDSDVFLFRGGAVFGRTITFTKSKSILQPYFKVMGAEQFSSGGEVSVSGDSWRPTLDGVHAEIGAGIVWQLDDHNQLHLDYEAAFGDNYDKPWGVNAGFRHKF